MIIAAIPDDISHDAAILRAQEQLIEHLGNQALSNNEHSTMISEPQVLT